MDRIAALNEILTENPKDAFARYGLAMEYSGKVISTAPWQSSPFFWRTTPITLQDISWRPRPSYAPSG